MRKFFIQGAGSIGGASLSALQGKKAQSGLRSFQLPVSPNALCSQRNLTIILLTSIKWLLPLAALVSVPLSRHALISTDLSLVLLSAAAIFLTVWFTALDWRKEDRV